MKSRRIKLLLIEDFPWDAALVLDALRKGDDSAYESVLVDNLAAAIDCAKDCAKDCVKDHAGVAPFDLILLDLGLPDAQGVETFVRAHESLPDIPIMVLSGASDEDVAIQCVRLGAMDYLLKKLTIYDALPRAIRYAIERHHLQVQKEVYASNLRRKNQLLEEELRIAREIQQRLIPLHSQHFADLSGSSKNILQVTHYYRSSTTFSGDFFHVLRLPENKVSVIISDVMGHGVRASLMGVLARGLLEECVGAAADPGIFLGALNHSLSTALKTIGIDAFATAFYLVADLKSRQFSYANAGHPNPLRLLRDANVVDWLETGRPAQPPLGLLPETVYTNSCSELGEHDSLLLYTNGLPAEENAAGEQFGRQRLFNAVRSRQQQSCETLVSSLALKSQEFSGHEEFTDDVCLVGLEFVKGAGARF